MTKTIFSPANLARLLLFFFIYCSVAPSVRLMMVGGKEMAGLYEAFITMLPDIFLLLTILFSLATWRLYGAGKLNLMDKLVGVFFFFNVVYGTVAGKDLFIAAQGFRVTYLPVLFYFVGRIFINYPEPGKSFLHKIALWYLVFGVAGIILHFIFPGFELDLIKRNGSVQQEYFIPRIGSFVLMPVLFATLMALTCLYFCFLAIKEGSWLNYLFVSIAWSCVFLSVSRGPIIAFLVLFGFMSVAGRQWLRSSLVLGFIVAVSALWSLALTGSLDPVGWLFSSAADTLSFGEGISRVELWKKSIHDFTAQPRGYGLGKAGTVAIRFLKETDTPAAVYTSDGWYLKLACETGIPGLISFLAMAGFYFWKGIKYILKNRMTVFLFLFSAVMMINLQCVVGNTLDFYPSISLYWLMLAFSVNYLYKEGVAGAA